MNLLCQEYVKLQVRNQCLGITFLMQKIEQEEDFCLICKSKFWLEAQNRWISLRISRKGLRIIEKKGIETVLKDIKRI